MTGLPAEDTRAARSQAAGKSQCPGIGGGDPASVVLTQSQRVNLEARGSFLLRVSDVSPSIYHI